MPATNRRAFMAAAAAACCGPIARGRAAEPAVSASPIAGIDCHTHFYDPTRPEGVPWPGRDDEFLYRPVLPEEFVALAAPCGITHTIVVEASPREEDNAWLLELAAREPSMLGVVGRLTPGGEDFGRQLERFAANPLFRGIRIGHDEVRTGLKDRRFLADLQRMADRRLTLDVNGGPDLPADAARLAGAVPRLTIVINHLANVRIDGQAPSAEWTAGMSAAAERAGVFCKVSALVEGAHTPDRPAPADVDFYRPVLDAAWRLFGDERLIFGSNWPVSARYGDYARVQAIVRAYVSQRGAEATSRFFVDNSRTAYRWPGR
jgi:L-fuconolactonase